MLQLHGINKAIDVFLHLDFKLAQEVLEEFHTIHKEMLPSNGYYSFVSHFDDGDI